MLLHLKLCKHDNITSTRMHATAAGLYSKQSEGFEMGSSEQAGDNTKKKYIC